MFSEEWIRKAGFGSNVDLIINSGLSPECPRCRSRCASPELISSSYRGYIIKNELYIAITYIYISIVYRREIDMVIDSDPYSPYIYIHYYTMAIRSLRQATLGPFQTRTTTNAAFTPRATLLRSHQEWPCVCCRRFSRNGNVSTNFTGGEFIVSLCRVNPVRTKEKPVQQQGFSVESFRLLQKKADIGKLVDRRQTRLV